MREPSPAKVKREQEVALRKMLITDPDDRQAEVRRDERSERQGDLIAMFRAEI